MIWFHTHSLLCQTGLATVWSLPGHRVPSPRLSLAIVDHKSRRRRQETPGSKSASDTLSERCGAMGAEPQRGSRALENRPWSYVQRNYRHTAILLLLESRVSGRSIEFSQLNVVYWSCVMLVGPILKQFRIGREREPKDGKE